MALLPVKGLRESIMKNIFVSNDTKNGSKHRKIDF